MLNQSRLHTTLGQPSKTRYCANAAGNNRYKPDGFPHPPTTPEGSVSGKCDDRFWQWRRLAVCCESVNRRRYCFCSCGQHFYSLFAFPSNAAPHVLNQPKNIRTTKRFKKKKRAKTRYILDAWLGYKFVRPHLPRETKPQNILTKSLKNELAGHN